MSLTYSAALVELASASSGPGCVPSPSAKSTTSAAPCLPNASQTSPSTETFANYQQLDWLPTESAASTSSPAVSPAKTLATPEKAQDLPALGRGCGTNSTASSKKLSRAGRSSKTSQPFALEDWTKCCGASLRSGMTRNGTVFPRPPLAPLTDATASGLWPTPRASEWKGVGPIGSRSHEYRLQKGYLDATVQHVEKRTGKLNPQWVEWLMGFPLGWTDSKHWETRSSRKSRKSLRK